MKFITAVIFSCLLQVFSVVLSQDLAQRGCPDESEMDPCTCEEEFHGYYNMMCENILGVEKLKNIFLNSDKYSLNEVHIMNSVIAYVPHEIFKRFTIEDFYVQNVRMTQLFDEPPTDAVKVSQFYLYDVSFQRQLDWKLLEKMTGLEFLTITDTQIKIIGENFGKYVNKKLKRMLFMRTGTRKIVPGSLANFGELEGLTINRNELYQLTRDMFPRPSSLAFIVLEYNYISYIPTDLFEDMPKLSMVRLTNNLIKSVPESAFLGSNPESVYLYLEGNPLRCNCTLQWIVKSAGSSDPPQRIGTCATPRSMENRPLAELTIRDFGCAN